MINDTIINFYLLYTISSYIDRQLKSFGIEPSDVSTYLSTPMSELDMNEKFRRVIVKSVINRFYAFNTSLYPQFCCDYTVWK